MLIVTCTESVAAIFVTPGRSALIEVNALAMVTVAAACFI